MRSAAGLLIASIMASLLVGAFDGAVLFKTYWQVRAGRFPAVSGTITHSEVITHERWDSEEERTIYTFRADIRYEYEVAGRDYSGRGHRYDQYASGDPTAAEATVRRYRIGRRVPVYYDPSDPARSVLERSVSKASRWLVGLTGPLTVGVLGLWGWYARALSRQSGRRPAAGQPVRQRGGIIHVSLPRYSPIEMAWGMALWTSVAGVFVIGAGVGDDPLRTLQHVAMAAAAVAVITYVWRRFVRARRELIIDQDMRLFTLPRTFGRKRPVTIPFDAVKTVTVKTIASGGEGAAPTYAPTVVRLEDGRRIEERLAHWSDEDKARQLARWLSGKLGPPG